MIDLGELSRSLVCSNEKLQQRSLFILGVFLQQSIKNVRNGKEAEDLLTASPMHVPLIGIENYFFLFSDTLNNVLCYLLAQLLY